MASGSKFFRFSALCIIASLLLSCSTQDFKDLAKKDVIDPKAGLSRDDYKNQMMPETPDAKSESAGKKAKSSIPDMAPIVVAPKPPPLAKDKLVSISVTEDVPLKEVLLELGRLANVDMELDPEIKGGIILRVKNRPFSEVIERVCSLAKLRYTQGGGVMKIEVDTPYLLTYHVNFLNLTRSGQGNISVSTALSSGSGGTSGSSSGDDSSSSDSSSSDSSSSSSDGSSSGSSNSNTVSSGSSNSITSQYNGDLWASVQSNLSDILHIASAPTASSSPTSSVPYSSPYTIPGMPTTGSMPGTMPTNGMPTSTTMPGTTSTMPGTTPGMPTYGSTGMPAYGSAAMPGSSPTAMPGSTPAPPGSSLTAGVVGVPTSSFSINKQAGIINVTATEREHESIKRYIDYVKDTVSSQVLIEAKVVEVTLSEEFHTGVNWDLVDRNLGIGFQGSFTDNIGDATDKVAIGILNKTGKASSTGLSETANIQEAVQLTEQFGVTRTLSSPRLNAMNNQQAVLSFAENQVYFTLSIETTDAQTTGGTTTVQPRTTVSSTLNTVPIGMMLTLQPSINMATNEVTMNVRPTLTRITGFVSDPAVAYLAATSGSSSTAGVESNVPVVEVRQLDSIVKMRSGQIMVIGGLMQERIDNNDSGVPFLGTLPMIGNLFKSVGKQTNVIQTIIFIKATIVPATTNATKNDKTFYKKFTRDPNPFTF